MNHYFLSTIICYFLKLVMSNINKLLSTENKDGKKNFYKETFPTLQNTAIIFLSSSIIFKISI